MTVLSAFEYICDKNLIKRKRKYEFSVQLIEEFVVLLIRCEVNGKRTDINTIQSK